MYIKEAKEFMKDHPDIEEKFKGCTEEEIIFLEKKFGLKIPVAFKEFLFWFGKKGGPILRGTDYYYKYLSDEAFDDWKDEGIIPENYTFKNKGIDLLNQNNFNGEEILKEAILFMCHQGYVIEYIKTDEGENPPVYIFVDKDHWRDNGPTVSANSFSEYILNMLKNEIDALKKIGKI